MKENECVMNLDLGDEYLPIYCGKCGERLPFVYPHLDWDYEFVHCPKCGRKIVGRNNWSTPRTEPWENRQHKFYARIMYWALRHIKT